MNKKLQVRFTEFKVEGKTMYCLKDDIIIERLELKEEKAISNIKEIKKQQNDLVKFKNNNYYLSQTGFEVLVDKMRKRKLDITEELLEKFRNKNNKNKHKAYVPEKKGIQHMTT